MHSALEDTIGPALELISDVNHNCARDAEVSGVVAYGRSIRLTCSGNRWRVNPISSTVEHLKRADVAVLAQKSEALVVPER